jgi:hypothetical protein
MGRAKVCAKVLRRVDVKVGEDDPEFLLVKMNRLDFEDAVSALVERLAPPPGPIEKAGWALAKEVATAAVSVVDVKFAAAHETFAKEADTAYSSTELAVPGGEAVAGAVLLSSAELVALTERTRRRAQRRVLDALGISYRLRPDGTIVVLRESLNAPAKSRPASPALRVPEARGVLARPGRQVASARD